MVYVSINMESGTFAAKTYTATEVSKHNSASNCWIIVDSGVYNFTSMSGHHTVSQYCGKNGPSFIGPNAHNGCSKMSSMKIGVLATTSVGDSTSNREYSFTAPLKSKIQTSPTVTSYYFSTGKYTVTVTPSNLTSALKSNVNVGNNYQCFYYGTLSNSTKVNRCVDVSKAAGTPAVITPTPSATPSVGTSTGGTSGTTTTTKPAEPAKISYTGVGTFAVYSTTCVSDNYTTGILKGLPCKKPISTLDQVLTLVKNVIYVIILPLVGTIFVIMTIVGGIVYISSAGNPKRIELGKKILTAAIIGLIITVLAYSIIYLFTSAIGGGIA